MMGISVIILGGLCASLMLALVVAVLVVWMQNRQESTANPDFTRQADSLPLPGAGSPASPAELSPDLHGTGLESFETQALELARAGNKLEAIKVYRAATGMSLAEAKNAVEALERGQRPAIAPVSPLASSTQPGEARIRELIAAGNKIEAIKVYRQLTGSDLATAKNAIEALERGEPVSQPAAQEEPAVASANAGTRIRDLLAAGKKLEAIKVYREHTESDLATAKEAVEAIEREMKAAGGGPV